jgi:methylglyoxal synthase
MSAIGEKPKLLILASREAMRDPSGPLLRFIRDYSRILKKFEIDATGGTARSILSTGFYKAEEVKKYRFGPEGGVVELAAIVARRECETVIFLSDPKDLLSGVQEDEALQRVCKELNVRLVTTLASAEQWACYEANEYVKEWCAKKDTLEYHALIDRWRPGNWQDGFENVGKEGELSPFSIEKQTLALIAHDKKKEDMAVFAHTHIDFLSRFHRILTTGTTGFLLKLLHAGPDDRKNILSEAETKLGKPRLRELKFNYWMVRLNYGGSLQRQHLLDEAKVDIPDQHGRLEKELQSRAEELKYREKTNHEPEALPLFTTARPEFVRRIMPLPSGPKGGDILIAEEVLRNRCHAVVFFQDPGTAQPHDPDIHLFERSCQFWTELPRIKRVYATCVSDSESARKWASYMSNWGSFTLPPSPDTAHELRRKYKLRDVIILEDDTDSLQESLARAAAGYFHRRLCAIMRAGKTTKVLMLAGALPVQVVAELAKMKKEDLLSRPTEFPGELIWQGETLPVDPPKKARQIITAYRDFYEKGTLEILNSETLINDPGFLPDADIVLAPCETINASFYRSRLKSSSQKGTVICACGGAETSHVELAGNILGDGLISVLVTNRSVAMKL